MLCDQNGQRQKHFSVISKIMITSVRMFISKDNEASLRLCNGDFLVNYSFRMFWMRGKECPPYIIGRTLNCAKCRGQRNDFSSDHWEDVWLQDRTAISKTDGV